MFNVSWTDPGAEKVGERKARKEKEHDLQDGEDTRLTKRRSTSTRRSSSSADKSAMTQSSADKAPSWFGGVTLKKNRLSAKSKMSHAPDLRIPIPGADTVPPSLPTSSTFCSEVSSTSYSTDASPESKTNRDSQHGLEPIRAPATGAGGHRMRSARESTVPRLAEDTSPFSRSPFRSPFRSSQGDFAGSFTGQPRAKAVKTFGADRWIRKTTETLMEVTQLKTETEPACARSEVTVSAARLPADRHIPSLLRPLDTHLPPDTFPGRTYAPSPAARPGTQPPSHLGEPSGSRKTPRFPARTADPPLPPVRRAVRFRAHDPSRWKAPDEWDVDDQDSLGKESNQEKQFRAIERTDNGSLLVNSSLVDLTAVQREIKKMAQLALASIVSQLDGPLADSSNPLACRDAEMERKRLMLHALGVVGEPRRTGSSSSTKGTKILALFESEATASYLAAVHAGSSITHLSPSPLSPRQFPNVRPLVSPAVAEPAPSLPPNYFSAVNCLPFPSILPSQDMPGLLRTIHTCLLPGGALHLVLINPTPVARSLGPHMRQWMEEHLLLNLERRFRCTNPGKLVPMWLGEAGFGVGDGTETTLKCQAVFHEPDEFEDKGNMKKEATTKKASYGKRDDSKEEDTSDLSYGGEAAIQREQQTRLELQSRIGRLLWQEIWGSYVNADRWWWDEPECVEECGQLGTYWECSIIDAVKDR